MSKSVFETVEVLSNVLYMIKISSKCANLTRAYNRYWDGCTDPDVQIVGKAYDRLDAYDGFDPSMTFAEVLNTISDMMNALARVYNPEGWYDADEDYIREKLSEF